MNAICKMLSFHHKKQPSYMMRLFAIFLLFLYIFSFSSITHSQTNHKTNKTNKKLPSGFVAPVLKKFIRASFPKDALKNKKKALVILQLIVNKKGTVAQVKITRSANKILDKIALSTVKKFEFIPATFKGKPVPVKILYRYHFFLRVVKKNSKNKPTKPTKSTPTTKPTKSTPTTRPTKSTPTTKPTKPTKKKDQKTKQTHLKKKKDIQKPTKTPFIFLSGYVLERGTRKPIDGATIYILGRGFHRQVIADSHGLFKLTKRLPVGRFRLVIPVPNYKRFEIFLNVLKGKKRSVRVRRDKKSRKRIIPIFREEKNGQNFYLRGLGSGLFETVTRERKEKKEIHRETIRQEELSVIPGTQGDPLKVVQNLPGVARTPLSTGFFIVRGSAPDDSRVYLQGHQIPQLYHFGGLTAVINGDMAKSINFIPGGFSVAYGRSLGGVINLRLRKGKKSWHGYLDFDQIDIGFFLEGPLWKGATMMLSARRSHIDAFLNLILPKTRGFDLTVAPRYYDFQIKLDWRLSPLNSTYLMLYGSDDALSFLREQPMGRSNIRGSFGFSTSFYRLHGGWIVGSKKHFENELSFDIGFTFSDVNGGGVFKVKDKSYVLSLREELRVKLLKTLGFRAGIDLRISHVNLKLTVPTNIPRPEDPPGSSGSSPMQDMSDLDDKRWLGEPALYFELDWHPFKALRTLTGVRVDYFSEPDEFIFNPRFSLVWTPIKSLSFTGSIGLFSQPPGRSELSKTFGNPQIQSEHSIHYTLGTKIHWKCSANLDQLCHEFTTGITFYYKDMYHLIVSSNAVIKRDGEDTLERLKNAGIGRAYGVELMLRFPPHRRFFGWLSYTLGRSERQDAPDKKWRLFNYDQTHILTFVGALKLGYGFSFSARFRVVSGNPYTPLKGGIFDADSSSYISIPEKLYSKRQPLFHQLDLRLDYKITFPTWMLKFYLDVRNVYNQPNQEGTINNYDYTKTAPLTGVPIFPSLGVKGEF